MNSFTITLDDDPIVPQLIEAALRIPNKGFKSAAELVKSAEALDEPTAAFIDLHLDPVSNGPKGTSIIPQLRKTWPYMPIFVITADPSDEAVREALAAGANDFIRKPLRPLELISRLQTRLTDQAQKEATQISHILDMELNRTSRHLKGPTSERFLSPTELNLFLALTEAKGTVVSRHDLKAKCWDQIQVSENALDRKIHELRKILTDVGSRLHIQTTYGSGFCIASEVTNNNDEQIAQIAP